MSLEKSELKIAVATDIGASIEDSYEAAKKEMYRQEGAVTSFGQAAKACEMLCEVVNKDLDEGRVPSMEHAEMIKLWITRAANAQRNLARNAENMGMSACGKVSALEGAVALISKYRQVEQLKIAAARLASPSDPDAVRPAGSHPAMSIKERRLAEEAEEKRQADLLVVAEQLEPAKPALARPLGTLPPMPKRPKRAPGRP